MDKGLYPLSFRPLGGEGDAYSAHAQTLQRTRGRVFPHSLPLALVGSATLLLWEVLAAVLNVVCHLCLQSETKQGRAPLLDSSIYLAKKPGYTILGSVELLCPQEKDRTGARRECLQGSNPRHDPRWGCPIRAHCKASVTFSLLDPGDLLTLSERCEVV